MSDDIEPEEVLTPEHRRGRYSGRKAAGHVATVTATGTGFALFYDIIGDITIEYMHRFDVPVPETLTATIAGAAVVAGLAWIYDLLRYHGLMPQSKRK